MGDEQVQLNCADCGIEFDQESLDLGLYLCPYCAQAIYDPTMPIYDDEEGS